MNNSESYYKLPTIRNMRRKLRRYSQAASKECGGLKATLVLKDINDANILKTRRWRNRIRKSILTEKETIEELRAENTNN